ncbi:MAG TPA: SDR family NAD(P)-dependent oxidoreductase [Solirubrobacteraceae bacterium]|jgi:short-subunit dehydrogenase|nr:SDR family NAD(P)-dependent oxidoreductase [Solirubrobacteraceae bacterium]
MQISGAKVLLTGASGGIGHAIARTLSERGGELILTGRRVDVLEPLAAELNARVIAADLADRSALDRLLADAGEIDILVANAALPGVGALDSFTVEEIDRALDVNLRAPIMLAHALAPEMVKRGRGHLLFMSSLNGKAATPLTSIYNATKFGMRGFASAIREDLRSHDVGVSTIFPGFIRDAGMFADSGTKLPPGVGTRTPQDVARATVKAIERNRAETDVAPLTLRLGSSFASLAPEIAASVSRRMGAHEVAGDMASGNADKR